MSQWFNHVESDYGVNPYIFLGLYAIKVVCISYCLVQVWKALRERQKGRAFTWFSSYLACLTIPFLYVFVCGRNLPVWVRPSLVAILLVVVAGAVHRLRTHLQAGADQNSPGTLG